MSDGRQVCLSDHHVQDLDIRLAHTFPAHVSDGLYRVLSRVHGKSFAGLKAEAFHGQAVAQEGGLQGGEDFWRRSLALRRRR